MKKNKLTVTVIFSLLFLLLSVPLTVHADSADNCGVYDLSDSLSEQEEEELSELIKLKAEQAGIWIAAVFTDEGPYIPDNYSDDEVFILTKEYADDVYDELFENDGETGGIVMVVDYSHSFFAFSTGEKNMDAYQRYIYNFRDDIGPYLRSKDSYGAVKIFAENADIKHYQRNHLLKSAALGSAVSLVITLIVCFCISGSYKKHEKYAARHYVVRRDSRFILKTDQFVRQYVTKRNIESSSSSSGRSSGGSHSSHGGGGFRI